MIGLKYGAFDMQANGVRTSSTDVYSAPTRTVQADQLAERDGALVVKTQYSPKTFTAGGWLRAGSESDLEALQDVFKAAMSVENQSFDIDYNGGVRRYLATAQNVVLVRKSRLAATWSVQFICPDGVGWDVSSTALITPTGISTSTKSIPLTVGGSYKAEPLINLVLNTVSGSGAHNITIANGETLRGMILNHTWVNGDRIEIDSMNHSVYINNIASDFMGQFPVWTPGTGSLSYLDDLTTRDATIDASYTKRWL